MQVYNLLCSPCFLQKLYESFEEDPGYFQFATTLTSSDIDEIQKFLDASVDIGYISFTSLYL